MKLVEPGYGPGTRFTQNVGSRMEGLLPEPYAPFAQQIFAGFAQPTAVTTASDVAKVVWEVAHDSSARLHFAAGPDAVALTKAARAS